MYFSPTQLTMFTRDAIRVDGGVPLHIFAYRVPKLATLFHHRHSIGSSELEPEREMTDLTQKDLDSSQWGILVSRYSRLGLSNPGDKLLALSAAAEAYGKAYSDKYAEERRYMAGLWAEHMPFGLLWSLTGNPISYRPSYRAPSWSWASIDGEVHFHDERQSTHDLPCLTAKVLSFDTQLALSAAPYGQVTGAQLRIEGLMKDGFHCAVADQWIRMSDPEHDFTGLAMLDALEPSLTWLPNPNLGFTVSIMCIFRLPQTQKELDVLDDSYGPGTEHRFYGLVLRETEQEAVYSMIGLFWLSEMNPLEANRTQNWQASFRKRTVTLV